jgi:hypothetical protein
MPLSLSVAESIPLEKPGRREAATARTSMTTSTPADFSLSITLGSVACS